METHNTEITKSNNYTKITFTGDQVSLELKSYTEGVEAVATSNTTSPSDSLRGHSLKPDQALTFTKMTNGAVWVKSSNDTALIAYSF